MAHPLPFAANRSCRVHGLSLPTSSYPSKMICAMQLIQIRMILVSINIYQVNETCYMNTCFSSPPECASLYIVVQFVLTGNVCKL